VLLSPTKNLTTNQVALSAFVLFEEPSGGFTIPEGAPEYGAALEERRSWDAVAFGEKYGLKLVGASFFLVKASD
jgi:phosphatidylethanolamine-binding protein